MNFETLEQIAQSHTQQSGTAKNEELESCLNQGKEAFHQAHDESFNNVETLKKTCGHFIEAIRIKRNDLRAYLALAYLFTLVEDFRTAQEYLQGASRVAPSHPDLQAFLTGFEQFKKATLKARPQKANVLNVTIPQVGKPSRPEFKPNYNTLYQKLETFILDKLKDLFSKPQRIEPTVKPAQIKLLKASLKNLNQVIAYMEQELKRIEAGKSVAALRDKVAPFHMLKKRYLSAIQTSKKLIEIQDKIELWSFKTDKQVQVVNQTLTMSALTYGRVDVSRMMDGCDAIADELDHLADEENIDISLVESAYEQLMDLVEDLDEMVDDADLIAANQNKLADILG